MSVFISILIATFLISLISFVGALTLFLKEKTLDKILLILVALSAGALLGGAFFDLVPEAITKAGPGENSLSAVFLYLILGFCAFFVLEKFIKWHHHHSISHPEIKSFSYLILVSDGIHNFIDGLIIAGAFVASFPIGLATTIAVIFHEIPHELGNYGVLVYGGFKKIKALFFNFASAVFAILGGIFGFLLSEQMSGYAAFLLPFAAGGFIYIAASDLIPRINEEENSKKSLVHFMVFLTGIAIMALMKILVKEG
jgi:zinc and cadmium transporter